MTTAVVIPASSISFMKSAMLPPCCREGTGSLPRFVAG